jgi:hypothetical protein
MNSEEVSRKNADTLESSKFVKRDVLTSRRLLSFGRRHTQTHSEMALQLLSVWELQTDGPDDNRGVVEEGRKS